MRMSIAILVCGVALAACATAAPQARWDGKWVVVEGAAGTEAIEPLEMDWLESELLVRGIVGETAGRAVITVESLKGEGGYGGAKYFFKGSILWTKTGKTSPLAGEGSAHNPSIPYRNGPRARTQAIWRAVCVAAGFAIK
jgi:hypothetical protein